MIKILNPVAAQRRYAYRAEGNGLSKDPLKIDLNEDYALVIYQPYGDREALVYFEDADQERVGERFNITNFPGTLEEMVYILQRGNRELLKALQSQKEKGLDAADRYFKYNMPD